MRGKRHSPPLLLRADDDEQSVKRARVDDAMSSSGDMPASSRQHVDSLPFADDGHGDDVEGGQDGDEIVDPNDFQPDVDDEVDDGGDLVPLEDDMGPVAVDSPSGRLSVPHDDEELLEPDDPSMGVVEENDEVVAIDDQADDDVVVEEEQDGGEEGDDSMERLPVAEDDIEETLD